jgi:hypothetical protein
MFGQGSMHCARKLQLRLAPNVLRVVRGQKSFSLENLFKFWRSRIQRGFVKDARG